MTTQAGMTGNAGAAHLDHHVEDFVFPYRIEGVLLSCRLYNAFWICEDFDEGVTGTHCVHLWNFPGFKDLHLYTKMELALHFIAMHYPNALHCRSSNRRVDTVHRKAR